MPVTDVLFPVRANRKDKCFFASFRLSLLSTWAVSDANVCIADASDKSVLGFVESVRPAGARLRYRHLPHAPGLYNRAWNVNFGARFLVRSPYFLISDADLIWQPGALRFLLTLARPRVCVIAPRRRLHSRAVHDEFDGLCREEGKNCRMGGSFFLARATFVRMRGFDERFQGWGHEDTSFLDRFRRLPGKIKRPSFSSPAMHIHLWHPIHSVGPCVRANSQLRKTVKRELAHGKVGPCDTNPAGWGRPVGE